MRAGRLGLAQQQRAQGGIAQAQGSRGYDNAYALRAAERHMNGQHADQADPSCPVCKGERR